MNAPRASICALHGSGTGHLPSPAGPVTLLSSAGQAPSGHPSGGHTAKHSEHDFARRGASAAPRAPSLLAHFPCGPGFLAAVSFIAVSFLAVGTRAGAAVQA